MSDILIPSYESPTKVSAEFDDDEARVIRRYKRLVQKYGLTVPHICNLCREGGLDYALLIRVNEKEVLFECPHRKIEYTGYTI